ncbi:hypothetical protein I317_00449 [Kwoniella heveanensis CBS 569]|uniref:Peroxisomal membrane protein PEX14 n=1 Tax=Kwoniella heveanensis BCC8398 TaxID=1296120 RepID=A0A1B9GY40_9TREE|nr:hypothetical protein I316_02424 [Kwoniella heveanensis BCC8398]OCF45547.1 hypothetical protein I317_00449 [Kwoniella heveanensis CBS 569]
MDAGSSSNRQELIHNAVLFLNDPSVTSKPLASRIQFLESKGLTDPEIQQALSQVATQGASSQSHASPQYDAPAPGRPSYAAPRYGYDTGVLRAAPPEPPRRDWRDLFIMAVISGGVVYGLTALAKKYLLPHLQPPSTTAFQDTSSSLSSAYDEASKLLSDLSEQTNRLQSSIEEDREKVNSVVGEVEDALKNVRDGEERWREELRDIRSEVESVRELVPKMIEKHSQSQSAALTDLQAELRSLKTLLVSRQQQQQQQQQSQSTLSPYANSIGSPNGSSQGAPVSSTTAAANALLTPGGGRSKGIPAWQLPSSNSGPASASGGSGRSTPLNGGSAILGEDGDGSVKGKGKAKEEVVQDGA